MDYNGLEPQEYKKSHNKYLQDFTNNQTSTCETLAINKFAPKSCENTLKLNNSYQNANSSHQHMSTNAAIQLTKRNVLRDATNIDQFRCENQINNEEKENRYSEVNFF
jgi:hypothetical protein